MCIRDSLYVANYAKSNILKINKAGQVYTFMNKITNPYYLIIKGNYMYITEQGTVSYTHLDVYKRQEECLSIELMGKHSNIVLYNTDNNIILGCAHNIGEEKSKERELAGGLPYIYPPKQNKKNLLQTRFNSFKSAILKSNDSLKKAVADKYFSLSQITVQEICDAKNIDSNQTANSLSEQNLQILFVELHEFLEQQAKRGE